jgi:hypothetical protein
MTVTVEQIFDEFPEFARCAFSLVKAKLDDADAMTAATYAGATPIPKPDGLTPPGTVLVDTARDMRVKYLCAELLVLTPAGEFARLDPSKEPDGARSIYERRRIELDRSYNPLGMVL